LAVLFRIPSMLAGQRHPPPASQFVNSADATCWFVQNEFLSLPVWEFLGLPGLALEQPRNLTDQISWFVMDSDCSVARLQGLPPFAFAQAWVLQMKIFCCATWVWLAPVPALLILTEFALETELPVWELPASFHEQRSPLVRASDRGE
jgi:hypothetical protein